MNLFEKMFGTHSEREIKRIMPLVDQIAKALMKKEMLSRAEIAKIINENK